MGSWSHIICPRCNGTKIDRYDGGLCGHCGGIGTLSTIILETAWNKEEMDESTEERHSAESAGGYMGPEWDSY